MSNSEGMEGCLGIIFLIGKLAAWIGSGIVAWNWIEPNTFGQGILFLLLWGVLGKVFDVVLVAIAAGIFSILE